MEQPKCNYNPLEDKVVILISKKRCLIVDNGVLIKKGVSKKNAIIKIKGCIIPNEINTNLYSSYFFSSKDCEKIPFYEPKQ